MEYARLEIGVFGRGRVAAHTDEYAGDATKMLESGVPMIAL